MSDRLIKSEDDLCPPIQASFLDEVARYFGGDKSVAECFMNSYNYHLNCCPSVATKEDVLDYLKRFLPSNAPY